MTWRGLALYSAVFTCFVVGYDILGIEPSRPAGFLLSYGPPAAVAVWMEAAARRRRRSPCWELGSFVLFAWPIALPTYCFWSRGRAGWRALAGLVAAILAPTILGALLWALYGALGV